MLDNSAAIGKGLGVEEKVDPGAAAALLRDALGFGSGDLDENRLGHLTKGQKQRLVRIDGLNVAGAMVLGLATVLLVLLIVLNRGANPRVFLVTFAIAFASAWVGWRAIRLFADLRRGAVSTIRFTTCRLVNRKNLWYGSHWCYTDGNQDFKIAPVKKGLLPERIATGYIAPRSLYLVGGEVPAEAVATVDPDRLPQEK